MEYSSPEKLGIRSENILKYIKILENSRLSTHDIIIMRNGKIIYEAYWKPFHKDFQHRMYSVTKSMVSIAIGFLLDEGKLSLDDKIVDHFPEFVPEGLIEGVKKQTIRNMLMMSTGFPLEENGCWI